MCREPRGYPVRRGLSARSLASLEYWIVRPSAQLRTRRTTTAVDIPAARFARALQTVSPKGRGRRECRVLAAPAVPCARDGVSAHTSIQVQSEHSGSPCAMVLRLMARSPWRRIPLASIAAGLMAERTRLDSISLRQLDTSHGCQNHTLLPYANCAARPARIDRSQPQDKAWSRPAMPRARGRLASTATRTPRIVTTRTPLFMRRDGAQRKLICGE